MKNKDSNVLAESLGYCWAHMLDSEDKASFKHWANEVKECERELYRRKRKLYLHLRNTSEEYMRKRRVEPSDKGKPGRKRIYTNEERREHEKRYQHDYYLRRKNETKSTGAI